MATPKKFPQANIPPIQAPDGIESCGELPTYAAIVEVDGQQCHMLTSCWKLSPEEIERVIKTGEVWLGVFSRQMPMVSISGFSPFPNAEPEPKKVMTVELCGKTYNIVEFVSNMHFDGSIPPYPGYAGGDIQVIIESQAEYEAFNSLFDSEPIIADCNLELGGKGVGQLWGLYIVKIPSKAIYKNQSFKPVTIHLKFDHLEYDK